MKFSYNFLQSFFEKKLPSPEEMENLLMMRFFEVEEVKKNGDDFVIDIDVLPNRAGDCLSHIGVAREISAITGNEFKYPEIKFKEKKEDVSESIKVDVKNSCNRYILRGVEEVEVQESPDFIKKRLISCGLKSINNVVDITNYVMLETGQPLHAFDAEKIQGGKIIVRNAKKREKIVTLDEKRIDLKEDVLVIADTASPLGIAGIKGGIVPEVTQNTKKIYIEAANFDPLTIRRASQDIGVRTDASLRFEHGLPSDLAEYAIDRAVSMIVENAKGKALKGKIDFYPKREERNKKEIVVSVKKVRSVLGVDIPLKRIEEILRSLEFKIKRKDDLITVKPPYFRQDVSIEEDVIEEVGRIYGYENIEPVSPEGFIICKGDDKLSRAKKLCKKVLTGFGYFESYNYSFINQKKADFFNYNNLVEMEKPVSLEFKYLRPSLIPGLLSNLIENEKNFSVIKMFEIGKVFLEGKKNNKEKNNLGFVSSENDFYKAKGEVDLMMKKIFKKSVSFSQDEPDSVFFKKGRFVKVFFEKKEVGFFGEISEEAKKSWKVRNNAVFGEFDFEKMVDFYKEVKKYEEISRFPAYLFDISVLVEKKVLYSDVLEKINISGGARLKSVDLFDVYEGKELPKDMKSLAFRLQFQDKNKTLSSSEANKLQEKIIKTLDSVPGWKVRKK